jgi:hypothetical protein
MEVIGSNYLTTMDNFDKLVIALKDIVIEWKGNKAEDIANEIKNRIDCYWASDRESSEEEQTGVRDNIFEIQDVLNAL